jgi:phosphopantothenoylcysteine decarboxylase/phosphopantothenate--cysteine ligase
MTFSINFLEKTMLKNKKILIGVTGSIAIYKTLEIIRLFIKARASVRVIMSEEAKKFITPLTFEAISQNEVLHIDSESWANDLNHIHLGKWADIFIISPITANTLNKLANGIADNLLTQTILAFNKQIIIAPSANTNMILNPITKESLKKLEKLGFLTCQPQNKLLACNDVGTGALAEPQKIFDITARELLSDKFWNDKKVIVTGGGSIEKIDDVRCLTNFSSGKQADALAYAYYLAGANVTLISSKKSLHVDTLHVNSTKEYKEAINNTISKGSYLIMCAAISDFIPLHVKSGKLKKDELGDNWSLELVKNEDILLKLDKQDIKTIGFKAEMDSTIALKNARKMLEKKSLDAVCLNVLDNQNSFGSDKNKVTFITKSEKIEIELSSKQEIAKQIVELSKKL